MKFLIMLWGLDSVVSVHLVY